MEVGEGERLGAGRLEWLTREPHILCSGGEDRDGEAAVPIKSQSKWLGSSANTPSLLWYRPCERWTRGEMLKKSDNQLNNWQKSLCLGRETGLEELCGCKEINMQTNILQLLMGHKEGLSMRIVLTGMCVCVLDKWLGMLDKWLWVCVLGKGFECVFWISDLGCMY